MTLFVISYLAGVLTILTPCILPILPFVFSRAGEPFSRGGLPMLAGMALTFAAVASLAAFGGHWAVQANAIGRSLALALLALFGAALVSQRVAAILARPVVALGQKLSESGAPTMPTIGGSLLLGIATGLLWAPCAGPILGLVLTGAALNGASTGTALLLIAYAAGAATSLALALRVGDEALAAMKRSLGLGERVRQGVGVAVLTSVLAIGFGLDTGFLTRLSSAGTVGIEQTLLDTFGPRPAEAGQPRLPEEAAQPYRSNLPDYGAAPGFDGATGWLNAAPLQAEELRGKVVLVNFWTYSCINCIRTLPYVRAWAELIVNTLITAAAAASVTMALMVVCGWLVARRQAFHAVTDQLITLPMILPGIVLSVAMMDVALRSPIPLYSTLTIVVIAFVIHFLPFGMRYTYGGVLQIHKELEESAGVCGASPGRTLFKIVMPLLWPAIMAGWVFIFLNASRDLSTAIILAGPDTKTIAVAIFDRAVNGELSEVAALGLLWSLLMSSTAVAFYLVMKRRGTMILGM